MPRVDSLKSSVHKLLAFALALLATGAVAAGTGEFKDAVKARLEKNYAVVEFANGTKRMVPLASLTEEDRARLESLSTEHPLAHGKSAVVIAREPVTKTIVSAVTNGPVETVQLVPPRIPRDQLGGTCMLYGRVHWLDIAGFTVDNAAIYRVSNGVNPEHPWQDPRYYAGLEGLLTGFTPKPLIHDVPRTETDPFEWARGELRKGRPILASLPKEIWQALPPGFIAAHPWGGGKVGHQIVLNGFTWNRATRSGTFHVINSWNELPEFDLKTDIIKDGLLVIEQSLSPRGEAPPETAREVVKSVTFVRTVGKTNLYEVETNLGTRKVAATSEDAARVLVEEGR